MTMIYAWSTGGGVVKDLMTMIYVTDRWYAQGFLLGGSEGYMVIDHESKAWVARRRP